MFQVKYLRFCKGLFSILFIICLSSVAVAGPGGTKGKPGGGGGSGGGGGEKLISAVDDNFTAKSDTMITVNVIKNSDSGFKIEVTQVNSLSPNQWNTLPSQARVYLTSSGDLTYDPNGAYDHLFTGQFGQDSFVYTITDKNGQTASATVHVTIEGVLSHAQNQPPIAQSDIASLQEDSGLSIDVLANDVDPDGDLLSLISVQPAEYGQVIIQGTNLYYLPQANFNGTDSFSYTVSDGMANSQAVVTVTVISVNDPPLAQNDNFLITEGEVLNGSVLSNDSDVDGDQLTVVSYSHQSQYGGTVSMSNTGVFSYYASQGFTGTDSFLYTISDGNGGNATATVSVVVNSSESSTEIPYYVEALMFPEDYQRLNYPEEIGSGITITYIILEEVPAYYSETDSRRESFKAFTEQQKQVARELLMEVESFTNLSFVEVNSASDATVAFGLFDIGGTTKGIATSPYGNSTNSVYSDLWIDSVLAGDVINPGTIAFYALVHELGHAIGLGHPDLPSFEENRKYTVMEGAGHPFMDSDVTGYQLYDIAALQYLYGVNTSYASGDDIYQFSELNGVIKTIWDSGGQDTLDFSDATFGVDIDLREGHYSTIATNGSDNFAIAFGVVIEIAIGGPFDDRIVGNQSNNSMTGGGGADTFVFTDEWGKDTITDFVRGSDKLDFKNAGLIYSDFDINSFNGDTVLSYSGSILTLKGVSSIDSSDFY